MSSRFNATLRRLNVKRKVEYHGSVYYADMTSVGSIIDTLSADYRSRTPITLEVFLPNLRAWEVVENFANLDRALPRGKTAKNESYYRGKTLRIRDRRTNDIVLCAVLI